MERDPVSPENRHRPGSTGVTVGSGTNGTTVTTGPTTEYITAHTDAADGLIIIISKSTDEDNRPVGTSIDGKKPEKEEESPWEIASTGRSWKRKKKKT